MQDASGAEFGKGSGPVPDSSSMGSDSSGLVLPFSDWQLEPDEIEICKRPNHELWILGSGGFGKVLRASDVCVAQRLVL